ncbi:MAG: SAM-dependent methyltransferase [Acidobacteria bacterium]|nr:MAG: SAM-dependent methyltransferase [Acidobacteriota bacterium]
MASPHGVSSVETDKVFAGSVPVFYDTDLVPLIFEPYATDLVNRLQIRTLSRVLELAAGTGVLTRALASALPREVSITATDLNEAMLERAALVGTERPVEWRQADAMQLPFGDATFDAVLCQFGVMFFPDKCKAFSEVRRVLRPGGAFVFSVWDRIEENEISETVTAALASVYPEDPPKFLVETPYGYYDRQVIQRDLASAGFGASPKFDTVAARSRPTSADAVATAYCLGTPLQKWIETRNRIRLDEASAVVAAAIAKRFGNGQVDGKTQAHVISVQNS